MQLIAESGAFYLQDYLTVDEAMKLGSALLVQVLDAERAEEAKKAEAFEASAEAIAAGEEATSC